MTNPPAFAPIVSSISPSSANSRSVVQITNLSGSNFISGTIINLIRTADSNVTAFNVAVSSSSHITCTLNLARVLLVVWNISVANPNGMIGNLARGFTMLPNVTAKLYGIRGTTVYPLAVNFFDPSYGNPTNWAWNCSDCSSNVTTQNATHTYSKVGNYTVKLTITGGS